MLEYKGYIGRYAYEPDDGMFHGEVFGLVKDVVHFSGATVEEIELEFQESVDDYLALRRALAADDGTRYPQEVITRLSDGEHPITVYRDFHALTRPELAGKVDIGDADLARIEAGQSPLPDDLAEKIATALNVDAEDLVPWDVT
jgi:predicted HicB family RNase H-like nuclease